MTEKGTPRENFASTALTIELTNVVKHYSGKEHQTNGFWVMKHLLLGDLTPEWWISQLGSSEEYKKQLEWYSKLGEQQKAEKELKRQERAIREKAKEDIQRLHEENDRLRQQNWHDQNELAKGNKPETSEDLHVKGEIQNLLKQKESTQQWLTNKPQDATPQQIEFHERLLKNIDVELQKRNVQT